jgi:outer membrane biosynthesis protein TonB
MAAGLAGLAIGLAGLSATGLAAAAPAITIENPDVVPFPDRIVMNKVQNGSTDVIENDVGDVRIVNSGDEPLLVTGLQTTGSFELQSPPALPASVAPGASLVVSVLFTATGEGPGGGPHDGSLAISSNAADAPSRAVELSGFWQLNVGGDNEGTLQELLPTFGYATAITKGTQKLQQKGRIQAVGDEVIAPFWTRMNPSAPVTVRQLGAFHNVSSDTFGWFPKGNSGGLKNVLTQLKSDYQTLLPRRSQDSGPGFSSFTPSAAVFGFKLASRWSDPTLNPKNPTCVASYGEAGCGHMVRFWPIKDRIGVPMPGQYLATMDFADADSGNYDYQDNFYLVTNVVPEAAAVDATAPTLVTRAPAAAATDVDVNADVVASFSEAMHPSSLSGSTFTLTPAAGDPVAATVTRSADGTVATLDPTAALTAGTAYTATVTTGASDMAGNPLAAPETWSFTTAGTPPPVDPPPVDPPPVDPPPVDPPPVDPPPVDPSPTPITPSPKPIETTPKPIDTTPKPTETTPTDPAPKPADPAPADPTPRTTTTTSDEGPTPQAKAFCARSPRLSAGLARQMAAAKRLRARATTAGARAAAARQIAAILKKQRTAAADGKRFGCRAIETAAFCKVYPALSASLARQIAAARKARIAAITPVARAAAAKRVATLTKQQTQAAARERAGC